MRLLGGSAWIDLHHILEIELELNARRGALLSAVWVALALGNSPVSP
jgi:hypothetical protein